jgi:aspartate-semialdehyde dehydrogenase
MPPGPESSNRVAIVGASSLRGKELKQVLEDRNFPAEEIVLLDESVVAGTLTEAGGEPTFIRALDEDSFDRVRFAFFAGSAFDTERNWQVAQRAGATVIDLTGAVVASGRPNVWIPSLASVVSTRPGHKANGSAQPAPYFSPPAPVIIASTMALGLEKFKPERIVLTLYPPVSERDQFGIEELESQTTNLLSFRPIEQTIFGAQVAFNLLSAYGEGSKPTLAGVRESIVREVGKFLTGHAPVPAIRLVQAPVFYGYAFSAYADFAAAVPVEQLEKSLAGLGAKVAGTGDPAPTNVSVAGESEIQLACIEPDPSVAEGVWMWGVADNLRLAATNSVRIAEELVAKSASA